DAVTGNGFHARNSIDLAPDLTRGALWTGKLFKLRYLAGPHPRCGGHTPYWTATPSPAAPFARDPPNMEPIKIQPFTSLILTAIANDLFSAFVNNASASA